MSRKTDLKKALQAWKARQPKVCGECGQTVPPPSTVEDLDKGVPGSFVGTGNKLKERRTTMKEVTCPDNPGDMCVDCCELLENCVCCDRDRGADGKKLTLAYREGEEEIRERPS